MSIFANSKSKRKGRDFTLPDTGITGKAYGISLDTVRDSIARFISDDQLADLAEGAADGNLMPVARRLLEDAPKAIATIIAESTGQPDDDETLQGILDLPLADMRELSGTVLDATFNGQDPADFFAEWGKRSGLAGMFSQTAIAIPENRLDQPSRDTTSGVTSSPSPDRQPVDPETARAIVEGSELPPGA